MAEPLSASSSDAVHQERTARRVAAKLGIAVSATGFGGKRGFIGAPANGPVTK
jgi:hypothetical protein